MKRVCPVCWSVFRRRNSRQVCCSAECGVVYNGRKSVPTGQKACVACGKAFIVRTKYPKQVTCGRRPCVVWSENRKQSEPIPHKASCVVCRRTFAPLRGQQKYCGPKCAKRAEYERDKPRILAKTKAWQDANPLKVRQIKELSRWRVKGCPVDDDPVLRDLVVGLATLGHELRA